MKTTARRSPAPLALMAVIFWLSAQPGLDSGLGVVDDVGRKLVHVAVYCALTLLWFWALRPALPMRRALLAAALISLLYAASDEYHQSFVEDRDGRPLDVLIDLVGIVIASLLLRYDPRVRSVPDGEDP
jgi:VanZ family protein